MFRQGQKRGFQECEIRSMAVLHERPNNADGRVLKCYVFQSNPHFFFINFCGSQSIPMNVFPCNPITFTVQYSATTGVKEMYIIKHQPQKCMLFCLWDQLDMFIICQSAGTKKHCTTSWINTTWKWSPWNSTGKDNTCCCRKLIN